MKKKKIFSISMVKNEMDIIESFVRYNINIFDGMIILDNASTDNTLEILKLLKSEELPIFIYEDENKEFDPETKLNKLLLKAIHEFKADIVVPLDADEFIISSNKGNPRKILEQMDKNTYYHVKWKTYVPDFKNDDEKFIPAKITLARDEELEKFYKVILPKELVKNYNVKLTRGNHDLVFDSQHVDSIKNFNNFDLRIAHFPIRSKEQTASKIMVNWINALIDPKRTPGASFHWKNIFNELKKNEEIKNEDVIKFAKEYALIEKTEIKLYEDPIDLSFCGNIKIKYTNNKINPLANLLENCERISLDYLDSKNQIKNLEKEKLENEEKLKNKILKYQNSTSWIVTSPLRKISNILKNLMN
ncbi:glycosyltransferase family 2 protein [Methanobacterium oryzae]|uniref:glycosyltransferase family 2 protein n=1 Tax=Methanobacterium oryzae TaxID=69540 RepID=UPI003D21F1DB